jgi:hypothetical protein
MSRMFLHSVLIYALLLASFAGLSGVEISTLHWWGSLGFGLSILAGLGVFFWIALDAYKGPGRPAAFLEIFALFLATAPGLAMYLVMHPEYRPEFIRQFLGG